MPSPFMTVTVLVVLWLIVVVPMVLRRSDERRRERAIDGFGRAMRALGRRAGTVERPTFDRERAEIFVPSEHRKNRDTIDHRADLAAPARRPVPAAQEALMYPPDRSELSAARVQMLARRQRSLGTLIGGAIAFTVAALVLGGGLLWLAAGVFLAGLAGYLLFLRNQALRDRARRENRQLRAASRRPGGYDATATAVEFDHAPETVVRIDDDDIDLHSMDTIDLTGLYSEELAPAGATERRAS